MYIYIRTQRTMINFLVRFLYPENSVFAIIST